MNMSLNRRAILRSAFGVIAAGLPLPVLDLFLDGNGTAFAATGAPIPTRFGTWFWGLGLMPGRWIPAQTGAGYVMPDDLHRVKAFRDKMTILSGFNVPLDGASNNPHNTGVTAVRRGLANIADMDLPSFDVAIADRISRGNRFGSIEIACTNDPSVSYSGRSVGAPNPSEVDPVALYNRLFGVGFKDPNGGKFVPETADILQKSSLSATMEQQRSLMKKLGAEDRARLDQYFTSVRQVEDQLAVQMLPPAPAKACIVPAKPSSREPTTLVSDVLATHKVMVDLLVLGLACNQTKVFNIALTEASSPLRTPDNPTGYHQMTHEEPIDPKLGYQPHCAQIADLTMGAFNDLLTALDGIKEGDATLLDHSLVFAHTDVSNAKSHDVNGLPIFLAGTASGKVRSGLHIDGRGDPITRAGLTMQQVMGVPIGNWGTKSLEASKPISEILV